MFKTTLQFLKDFFSFSQKEMNGFLIINLLVISLVIVTIVYNSFNKTDNHVSEADQKALDSLLSLVNSNGDKVLPKENHSALSKERQTSLFAFDPNTTTEKDLIKLGLDEGIVARLIKYRTKGGTFKVKSDLKKLYGLSEEKFSTLLPYISLPETISINKGNIDNQLKYAINEPKPKDLPLKKLDLNTSDSTEFEKIYGIGKKLASRIVKYRNKLGGYVDVNQLKEVYGLDSNLVEQLSQRFYIENGFQPQKININTDNSDQMKFHPYIGYKKAYLLINYRKMHGTYMHIDQLKQIKAISIEEIEKMKPYIEF